MAAVWTCLPRTYFNPHSREGSDRISMVEHGFRTNFNPHSREGSDYTGTREKQRIVDFNPHSREGSDRNFIQKLQTFLFHLHNYRT